MEDGEIDLFNANGNQNLNFNTPQGFSFYNYLES